MSPFFQGMAIAGLEYPDKPFFNIPSLTSLSIFLSILLFISSSTVTGLMKMVFYQSNLNVPAYVVLILFHLLNKMHLCIFPRDKKLNLLSASQARL